MGNAHGLNDSLSMLEVFPVLEHHLPLFEHEGVNLLPALLQLLVCLDFLLGKLLFFMLKLFTLAPILSDFAFGNLSPFLKEFYVILLSLFFDHFVVLVHFAHQFDVALVHVLHVFFNFGDVCFGELDWDQIGHTVLEFKFVLIQTIAAAVLISAQTVDLGVVLLIGVEFIISIRLMREPIESVWLTADDAILLLGLVRKLVSLARSAVSMVIAAAIALLLI